MRHEEQLEELRGNLRKEHGHTPVSAYLKEVMYGGVDGIITTFAVVAGFSGAALSNETTTQLGFLVVLLFGMANLLADGVSMGLGNFLAVRSDQGLFCKFWARERSDVRSNREAKTAETLSLLRAQGFSDEDAKTLGAIYQKNERFWLHFIMNHGLEIPDPTDENPAYTGLATFVSFILFGFIPLIPFILFPSLEPQTVFMLASAGAFIALILLGILKWRVIRVGSVVRSIGEVVLIGGVAAVVAFTVGSLFSI